MHIFLAIAFLSPEYQVNHKEIIRWPANSLNDFLGDGFLWAVPKHRRTIEKRLNRKFGFPQYDWKPLRVKEHLRICIHCNNNYEAGLLCPHCYNKVVEETKQLQDEIQKHLGLRQIEKGVIVLYENERQHIDSENLKKNYIVEIPKKRPSWFTKNLLQKSAQEFNSIESKKNNLA